MFSIRPTTQIAKTRSPSFVSFRLDSKSPCRFSRQLSVTRTKRRAVRVYAQSSEDFPEERSLAPSKPQTPFGEMLTYYLKMEPQLFKSALEGKLNELRDQANAKKLEEETKKRSVEKDETTFDLTLSKRMEEVRAKERQLAVQDLMYLAVLEKFIVVGVGMLPRLDDEVHEQPSDLKALTEGVHSVEALGLVKEHVLSILGPSAIAFANQKVTLSKLQMAQVYAASIMFGYFLRGVDSRFQLERSLGLISNEDLSDAATRLEKLFQESANLESVDDPDLPQKSTKMETGSSSTDKTQPNPNPKNLLRQYVESFDQEALRKIASIVSLEAASLVERQTLALFGDLKQLHNEMQNAIGPNIIDVEDLIKKVQEAVTNGTVSTLTMTVGVQRRSVLEAVAFGTFLRDIEGYFINEFDLLTALPAPAGDGGPPDATSGGPMAF
eukprot:g3243.t1